MMECSCCAKASSAGRLVAQWLDIRALQDDVESDYGGLARRDRPAQARVYDKLGSHPCCPDGPRHFTSHVYDLH
jgi:hypothetical protein